MHTCWDCPSKHTGVSDAFPAGIAPFLNEAFIDHVEVWSPLSIKSSSGLVSIPINFGEIHVFPFSNLKKKREEWFPFQNTNLISLQCNKMVIPGKDF